MRAILHCPWCHSRTDLLTDGDGGLVERLNHPCTCQPGVDRRVKVSLPPRSKQNRRKRFRADCGTEVSGWSKRCPEHSKLHKRKQTSQREKDRRRQGWKREKAA